VKTLRRLLAWQPAHDPPTAEDVRQGRAFYTGKGSTLEAVLVRPEDVIASQLGPAIDGLPVEPDGCVTPGLLFFVVAE
jgi:hypothetical protein